MLVKESQIELDTPSGKMRTYIYQPRTGDSLGLPVYQEKKYPGLIFFTAIFQKTPGIERMAVQLAADGYVVYIPEIWHMHLTPGTVLDAATTEGVDKGNALKKVTKLEDWAADLDILIREIRANPSCNGRIGCIGHCIGGHIVVRACMNPEILCGVSFFATDIHDGSLLGINGKAKETITRLDEIKGEVMMIWGRQDGHIPDAGRLRVYEAFQKSKAKHTWFEFNANHSFMMDNDPKGRYDGSVAHLCYSLALDLFHRAL